MLTAVAAMVIVFIAFTIGFFVGLANKGVHININQIQEEPKVEEKKEYNKSTIEELPDNIRLYYEQNKGFIE